MTLRYGAIQFSLPEGFADDTVVTLTSPVPKVGTDTNIVMRTQPLPTPIPMDVFVDLQAEMVKQTFVDTRADHSEKATISGKDFVLSEFTFSNDGHRIRQLQAYFLNPTRAFVLCATADDDSDFPSLRATVLKLLATIDIDP